jgi:CLIP-associating protein 1/2
MEQEAQGLLMVLKRSTASIDQKITAFNSIKSNIKHLRVPDAAQPTIFECIRIAISSTQSPTLASTAFSTLGHLIKRLNLQQQNNVIVAQAKKLLPILLERLGDSRESHRNAAAASLGDFFPYVHDQVEAIIKDNALAGNSPRAKETAMMWVLKVRHLGTCLLCATNCITDAQDRRNGIQIVRATGGGLPRRCRRHGSGDGQEHHCTAVQVHQSW